LQKQVREQGGQNRCFNKTNLFEQTLDHYFVNVIKPRVDKYLLTDEGDAYNNICSFYSSSFSTKPKQRPGCLAVNTTIESHINIATQNKLVSFNKVLEDGFYYQLNRICTLKPKSTSEIRKRAKLLTLSNHGFFCMMKLGNNDEELRDYIESIVLSIKWER